MYNLCFSKPIYINNIITNNVRAIVERERERVSECENEYFDAVHDNNNTIGTN